MILLCSEQNYNIEAGDVIKRCIDLKYIEDISYAQTSSKLVTFDKDNTRLSYDGLKFLEENDFTDISHFPLIIDDLKI